MCALFAIVIGMVRDVRAGIGYIVTFTPGVDWRDPARYEQRRDVA